MVEDKVVEEDKLEKKKEEEVVETDKNFTVKGEVGVSNPCQVNICFEHSAPQTAPLAKTAIMSTPTVCCLREDEMAWEMTGNLPSNAEAKKDVQSR